MRPTPSGPQGSAARFALRRAKPIVVALTLAMALLAGCAGGSDDAAESSADAPQRAAEPAPAEEADAAGEAGAADGDDSARGADEAADGGEGAPPLTQVVAAANDRIVREGTMRLEVEEAGFDAAFDRVVTTAERLGGTVLSSDATSDDEGLTSGSVTVRVPAENYDRLLTGISEIATVRERSITSEDVSGEFVDLEARLRHNEAQERFYLSLLEQAEGVEDAIAVQQRVTDIQQTIEQIKGRLSYLEERTSFSRLTVELYETGTVYLQQSGGAPPRFAEYWESAREGFVAVVGTMLVVTTALLPIALLGLVIVFAIRYFRRTGARPQSTPPPPPAPQPPAPARQDA